MIMEEAVRGRGGYGGKWMQGVYGNSQYLHLNFAVNLELPLKNSLNKKNFLIKRSLKQWPA